MKLKVFTSLVPILTLYVLAQPSSASSSELEYCYSTYALCTIAKCTVPPDGSPVPSPVECRCTVSTGYSVGGECNANSDTLSVISRYSPIFSYQECPGVIEGKLAVWANCLNAPCTINPNNTGSAVCECQTMANTMPFVLATDHADAAACRTCTMDSHRHYDCPRAIYSSANTPDAKNIT